MPQCVGKMVQVSNLYLQRGATKILNKRLSECGRKPITNKKCWAIITLLIFSSSEVQGYSLKGEYLFIWQPYQLCVLRSPISQLASSLP